MYHSITFTTEEEDLINAGSFNETTAALLINGVNTWDEWHLIPSSRPSIAMPTIPSEKFIEIPGRDGSIDLTDYLSGKPVFGDRQGALEFYHQNGYEDYETVRREMASYFHGNVLKMILEDDPGYYYEGRFKLSPWKSDAHHSTVGLEYRVGPYKWNTQRQSLLSWPWDNFSLERDYDYFYPDRNGSLQNPVGLTGYTTIKVYAVFPETGSVTINGQTKTGTNFMFQSFANVGSRHNRFLVSYTGTPTTLYFRGGQL